MRAGPGRGSTPLAAGAGAARAMGDRERNKKRLLELLRAPGTGNARCADCGAPGKRGPDPEPDPSAPPDPAPP